MWKAFRDRLRGNLRRGRAEINGASLKILMNCENDGLLLELRAVFLSDAIPGRLREGELERFGL